MNNENMYDYYNYVNNYTNNYDMLNMNNLKNVTQPNNNSANNLLDPYSGFIRGNLFNNLYDKYKNFIPREIKTNNPKESLLFEIMQYYFVLIDLNLYLDIYNNDQNTIKIYNKYLLNYKKLVDEYQKNYGPLSITNNYVDNNTWSWINSPWPWEGEV